MTRVMAFDVSTTATGVCVLDCDPVAFAVSNAGLSIVAITTLKPRGDLIDRLRSFRDTVPALLEEFTPSVIACEEPVSFAKQGNTPIKMGMAAGIVAIASNDLPVFLYPPSKIKKAVAGHGHGKKWFVAEVAAHRYGFTLPAELDDNATDALAVAVCHCLKAWRPVPIQDRMF